MGTAKAPTTVTILKERHEELLESERWETALRRAGVDNWDGYEDAIELFNEDEE